MNKRGLEWDPGQGSADLKNKSSGLLAKPLNPDSYPAHNPRFSVELCFIVTYYPYVTVL